MNTQAPYLSRLDAIEVEKSFRDGSRKMYPLRGVNFSVAPGEFVVIMGSSGSGKSTLLSILGTLDSPDSGAVSVDGFDVTRASRSQQTQYRRENVGFVFQSYNLFPAMTALENVMLPLEFTGTPPDERKEKARNLLHSVGLQKDRHSRKANKLSGGEQQRVGVARALVNDPLLILADEPTGNLDPENSAAIITLLSNIAKQSGTSVVVVTHEGWIAEQADTVYRLQEGLLYRA